MDQQKNLRIRDNAQQLLDDVGLNKELQIATHCQSHHRSSFTYMTARILDTPISAAMTALGLNGEIHRICQ